jgi:hypothetical protein
MTKNDSKYKKGSTISLSEQLKVIQWRLLKLKNYWQRYKIQVSIQLLFMELFLNPGILLTQKGSKEWPEIISILLLASPKSKESFQEWGEAVI